MMGLNLMWVLVLAQDTWGSGNLLWLLEKIFLPDGKRMLSKGGTLLVAFLLWVCPCWGPDVWSGGSGPMSMTGKPRVWSLWQCECTWPSGGRQRAGYLEDPILASCCTLSTVLCTSCFSSGMKIFTSLRVNLLVIWGWGGGRMRIWTESEENIWIIG